MKIALLQKFFPNMERFESHVRKYKHEIDKLAKKNANLEREVSANKPSLTEKLELHDLRRKHEQTMAILNNIPEDILREAAARVYRPKTKNQQTHER